MSCELSIATHASEWDGYISSQLTEHFMQSFAWGELQRNYGWLPEYHLLKDDGNIRAAILILSRKLPLLGKRFCYAPRGPVFDPKDPSVLQLIMSKLKISLARNGAIFLRCDPYLLADDVADSIWLSAGFTRLPRQWSYWNAPKLVFWLDLQTEEKMLFNNLSPTCRNEIRAGYKNDIEFVRGGVDDLDDFQRLMVSMGKNKGIVVKNRDYYHKLYQHLTSSSKVGLFLARYQGKNIAAGMSVVFGNTAWLLYAASDKDYYKLKPNRTLQWEMIKWARDEGCTRYDFRGTAANDPPQTDDPGYGVYQFKKSFGPTYTRLAGYYDLVMIPSLYGVFRFGEEKIAPAAYAVWTWLQSL